MTSTMTPVEYAENALGIHIAWEEAQKVQVELERAMGYRDALAAEIRSLNVNIEDRIEVITDKFREKLDADGTKISGAEFERQVKVIISKDGLLRETRRSLLEARSRHETVESNVKILSNKARMLSDRQHLLGGLLSFYAACKTAQTEAMKRMNPDPLKSWP